ncbi:hemerythrin domain-containing protein [Xylanimonas protaetiae]|uniref:Hemerythrin domain-containing protein n=1 Tax=Xylanimonas protaetiae TaxID=2509457 RepID=A0A4P6F621_9MICO|nr:hemerythrin domain-containing protein [Xylanimonas protaetiae]QAY71182.1 hemerythrin domain-containing protein [Xylanimonas protaetiae]
MSDFYVSAPGETVPPVPAGPRLCQGDDMRIVHNAFLWAYEQAPPLVRGVRAGDTARSAFVGSWLADLDATLHVHHEGEDELMWDKLEKRAPACALHVAQMRAHHAQVQGLLHEAGPLLAAWRTTADPALGEQLADAYARTLDVLKVHLRREVVEVVPVVERVFTQREWEALAEHGMDAIPRSRMMPQLGMLLASSSPADRAAFFAALPRPVRLLYRLVGRRQYATQYRALFPGTPVPATV